MKATDRGFSLIEVVCAVGILGAGLVALIGLSHPATGRMSSAREGIAAAAAVGSVDVLLHAQAFETVSRWMETNEVIAHTDGFAVTLHRREALTPAALDETAAWVAFDIVLAGSDREYRYAGSLRR